MKFLYPKCRFTSKDHRNMTTKAELIDKIAASIEGTKKQAAAAIDVIIDTIKNDLKKEGRCAIAGLGTFNVTKRAARTGRNPSTGEPLKIKASQNAKFKASPEVKEAAGKFKFKK